MKSIMVRFTALFLIFGCSCNFDNQTKELTINPKHAINENFRLSDLVEEITYIPLENKILFPGISRIALTDNYFFIGTREGILAFNRHGGFLNKIGDHGRGPGEYRYSRNFAIDSINEIVYIFDSQKIIAYTFQGTFIKEYSIKKFEGFFSDITYSDGRIFLAGALLYGQPKYDWLIIDTTGRLITSKENFIPEFKTKFPDRGRFFNSNDNIYYWNNYNDTVFKINNNSYKPAYYFARGDFRKPHNNFPIEDYYKYFNPFNLIRLNDITVFSFFFNNYLHLSLINNDALYIIDKSIESTHIDLPVIYNDLDCGPGFHPLFSFSENEEEYLVTWLYAYQIKSHIESEAFKNSTPKYPKKKKQLEKLAASLDENDNPVLMLVKLKD